MPEILKRLDLRNSIATWDALNTQKDVAAAVIEGKGDYVGALKGNQGNLYNDVKDYFEAETLERIRNPENSSQPKKRHLKTIEKEHSAVVTREYYIETEINWLYDRDKWAGLNAIGVEIKKIESNRKNTLPIYEQRYFITSVKDVTEFARAARGHWGIENALHWHLDYTFKDDKNTTMKDNGAEGLQIFKKIVLSLLKIAQVVFVDYTKTRPKNQKLITKATTIRCISCRFEKRIPFRTSREHHVLSERCFLSIFWVLRFPVIRQSSSILDP
jgi:predicted transposase YbfD/YdcC